ncbi:MAG: hypothetical protein ACKVZ6_03775 [Kineosporiaceae bacterium]|jgi:hypothetical protein
MSGPRFVLLSSSLASGARRTTWPDRFRLEGSTDSGGQWVAWRLLGRNNHELGRSATVFPDQDVATADIADLCRPADDVTVVIVADATLAEWRWRLVTAGRVAAVSSRSYLRQRECHYSASMFRKALETLASQSMPSQSMPWRSLPSPSAPPSPSALPSPSSSSAGAVGCMQ